MSLCVCFFAFLPVQSQESFWTKTADFPFAAGAEVPVNAIMVNAQGHYLAGIGTGAGLYRSLDSGKTWLQSNGSSWYSHCLSFCVTPKGTIIAAMTRNVNSIDSCWLLASTDNGANYSKLNFPNVKITKLYTGIDGNQYVATESGIYRSKDNGNTWQLISQNLIKGIVNCIAIYKNMLYAAVDGEGIFRSTDITANENDLTWKDIEAGVEFQHTNALQIIHNDTLAAANQYGVYVNNGSAEWTSIFGDGRTQVTAQTISDHKGTLLIGLNGGSGYVSHDNGKSWALLLTGFKSTIVNEFAIDSIGGILAATNTGVFRGAENVGLLALSNGILEFDDTGIGAQSEKNIVLSNCGNAALTISSAITSGNNADDFSASNIQTPLIIEPGKTVTKRVLFSPTKTGARETELRFTAIGNASSSTNIVLKGNGTSSTSISDEKSNLPEIWNEGGTIFARLKSLDQYAIAYSILGRPLIGEKKENNDSALIQWNNLSNGVYIIQVYTAQTSTTLPFIINQ